MMANRVTEYWREAIAGPPKREEKTRRRWLYEFCVWGFACFLVLDIVLIMPCGCAFFIGRHIGHSSGVVEGKRTGYASALAVARMTKAATPKPKHDPAVLKAAIDILTERNRDE